MKRALLSLSDKSGLLDLATALVKANIALISTGGTAKALSEMGFKVQDVSELTGFPEMMDGRVKTLHPKVHGGLLALRDNPEHVRAQKIHGIVDIDYLIVNLYPFEATIAKQADWAETIENIDIGGPAMIRAASKNHDFVTVITDPRDYPALIASLPEGLNQQERRKFAAIAFARTAAYDAAISTWLFEELGVENPPYRAFGGALQENLRYGENPHQKGAFYLSPSREKRFGVATATQLQGKQLSYNNINDTDAAFELVSEFPVTQPACAIIKHANPCGVAVGSTLVEAYEKAFACDTTSAFGGIVALNQEIDAQTATKIIEIFTEVIIAPSATPEAKAIIAGKKNLRLLLTGGLANPRAEGETVKTVAGGLLVQTRDNVSIDDLELRVVTTRHPTPQELDDLRFAFRVAKHVKSNAIVYVKNGKTLGIGAGQMSRVDSSRIAARKAQDAGLDLSGSAVASDAFFPFSDGLLAAASAGASCIIQPGGSMRDDEVIRAANEAGLAMVFTGVRHFRH